MSRDVEGLLARVEAAVGPDRELDIAVFLACGWVLERREASDRHPRRSDLSRDAKPWLYAPDGRRFNVRADGAYPAPQLTASVDAAVMIFRETLPGWWWSAGDCEREKHATIGPEARLGLLIDTIDGFGATVPLAILAALLRSLAPSSSESET